MNLMEHRGEKLRFCRKCLTRDLADGGETYRSLRAYMESLDPDLKAEEELYQERLGRCKECDLLLEGMCRSCGCYVELRAVMAKGRCPEKRW